MPKRRKTFLAKARTSHIPLTYRGGRKRNPKAFVVSGMGSKYRRGKK